MNKKTNHPPPINPTTTAGGLCGHAQHGGRGGAAGGEPQKTNKKEGPLLVVLCINLTRTVPLWWGRVDLRARDRHSHTPLSHPPPCPSTVYRLPAFFFFTHVQVNPYLPSVLCGCCCNRCWRSWTRRSGSTRRSSSSRRSSSWARSSRRSSSRCGRGICMHGNICVTSDAKQKHLTSIHHYIQQMTHKTQNQTRPLPPPPPQKTN